MKKVVNSKGTTSNYFQAHIVAGDLFENSMVVHLTLCGSFQLCSLIIVHHSALLGIDGKSKLAEIGNFQLSKSLTAKQNLLLPNRISYCQTENLLLPNRKSLTAKQTLIAKQFSSFSEIVPECSIHDEVTSMSNLSYCQTTEISYCQTDSLLS